MLGHALYLKAIHGGKVKNDKLDSEKLALLLRGGNFATAYAYPKELRATRDLLRRRTHLVAATSPNSDPYPDRQPPAQPRSRLPKRSATNPIELVSLSALKIRASRRRSNWTSNC